MECVIKHSEKSRFRVTFDISEAKFCSADIAVNMKIRTWHAYLNVTPKIWIFQDQTSDYQLA